MELLRPSPGKLADRQSILVLKLEAAEKKGIPGKHWFDELGLISRHLEDSWFDLIQPAVGLEYNRLYSNLLDVNRRLWSCEDEIRDWKAIENLSAAQVERVKDIAFKIADLNDKRAELVNEINQLWDMASQEKIYA